MNIYEISVRKMNGVGIKMEAYKGKVLLIVNTASKCGLTPQFKDLETLYIEYKDKGLEILGFPSNQFANQDPGSNEEILNFCQVNYGVTFPMFEKIEVNGDNTHPLYQYLKDETKSILGKDIKWNFTKFLVDRDGRVIKRYAPSVAPLSLKKDINKLLKR